MMTHKQMAVLIVTSLRGSGIVILRYDASSSNSIYLKFDYGVAKSLRIGDHEGLKHLSYRYNVMSNVTGMTTVVDDKGFERKYYSFDDVNALIEDILAHRLDMIERYGEANYKAFMQKNQDEHKNAQGFWKLARVVK